MTRIKNTTRIEANLLAYSQHPTHNIKLATFEVVLPAIIWPEVLTHKVFSRNAASFRAVPTKTFVQEIMDRPYMPIHWGKNQKGMQAFEEQDVPVIVDGRELNREEAWLEARNYAVKYAEAFAASEYHKQVVNRLLFPFVHMRAVISSTAWLNFDTLRRHPDAEPHINVLAKTINEQLETNEPRLLQFGEWHLPYITPDEEHLPLAEKKMISAERCARVSYKLRDGSSSSYDPEFRLYKSLVESFPIHASPIEHQATPDSYDPIELLYNREPWKNREKHGNFHGFIQNRKLIPGEATMEY